ncbi:protein kinase family protein [Streptomyces sp. NPDC005423]|uniref:protein kinase family protein n=1 Tax=Streptomyces sp. NPDC005423 TaxID=3155343 RepID=UPI00339EAD15
MSRAARLSAHSDLATSLALLSDSELAELTDTAPTSATGIGGRSALVEVDGRTVFVKRMPLTDTERRPANVRSTANVFALPAFCHYGIGSPGFGVWRELAVHTMTTNWVLSGAFSGFPLLHHWRVLPDVPQPAHEQLADVDRVVAYWGGSDGVRKRVEELRTATASLTLFLEYFPHTLHDWLGEQLRGGDPDAACALVERRLRSVTDFLHGQRLLHFDAHFENILTDGDDLYLTDYGLALSARFRLAPDEREFFDRHQRYDRHYSTGRLVNWLVTALTDTTGRSARPTCWRAPPANAPPESRRPPPPSWSGTPPSPPCWSASTAGCRTRAGSPRIRTTRCAPPTTARRSPRSDRRRDGRRPGRPAPVPPRRRRGPANYPAALVI